MKYFPVTGYLMHVICSAACVNMNKDEAENIPEKCT